MTKPTLKTATAEEIADALSALERICPTCSREFNPIRHWQTFCSDKCRKKFHGAAEIIARLEEQREAEERILRGRIDELEREVKGLRKLLAG